jgi:hypothetical protein
MDGIGSRETFAALIAVGLLGTVGFLTLRARLRGAILTSGSGQAGAPPPPGDGSTGEGRT